MTTGRFITFEGGEGAGKSTQLRRLAQTLAAAGIDTLSTREPGGAPNAEFLRDILLSGAHDFAPLTETLLHVAARAEHLARTIRPALAAGQWVLCDRFFDSTDAYQGFGQGADRATIAALARLIDPHPDLTLILDVSEATASARQAARGRATDRYDRLGPGFHARVAAGFRQIAAENPGRCVLIDANADEATVAAAILHAATIRLIKAPAMNAPPPRENALLFGHEHAEYTLTGALRGGRLHHAWLITGPEGVGRATLAYRFARRLLAGGTATLSTGTLEMDPAHPVFRRVAAGTHADLLTIEREWDDKKKRLKKNIAAEAVREIPGFLHLTPAEGGWRVVILDGAEDMNAHSANAVLKVLEEPPARAVLILVSAAPGRLLPTLRSRCRRLALSPLGAHAMDLVLRSYLPEMAPAQRVALAAVAQGAPGLALALADQDGLAITGMVAEITAALPDFPLLRGYEMADALRDEAAFDMFFTLLRRTIAAATVAALRGTADAAQQRLASLRSPADWGETWERMSQIHAETERSNLDKRQAVVTALALLG